MMLTLPIDLATNVRSVLGDGHNPGQNHLATSNFSVSSIVKSLRRTASFYSNDSRDFDEMIHQFHDDLDWDEPKYQTPRQYDMWHEVLKYVCLPTRFSIFHSCLLTLYSLRMIRVHLQNYPWWTKKCIRSPTPSYGKQ